MKLKYQLYDDGEEVATGTAKNLDIEDTLLFSKTLSHFLDSIYR